MNFIDLFKDLSPEEKETMLNHLNQDEKELILFTPDIWLRPNQIIPKGDWRYLLIKAGRGWGKGKAIAAHIRKIVPNHENEKGFAIIVGATHQDVSKTLVPAILNEFPPSEKPIYIENKKSILFKNGASIDCFSSDIEIRGPNAKYAFLDEICKFNDSIPEKIDKTFQTLDFAVRHGEAKIIITSTPKPFPWFRNFLKKIQENDPKYMMISGKTSENYSLADSAKKAFEEIYGSTRFGRQELDGEILTDNPDSLFTYSNFENYSTSSIPQLKQIVIAVDPAVSNTNSSDQTGIVVVGMDHARHCYILEDQTFKAHPIEWAKKVDYLFKKYKAHKVVAEKNQGGDLISQNLRAVNPNLPIALVHASKGKQTRAEPVAALAEQGKIHLYINPKNPNNLKNLQDECVEFTGDPKQKSPNRLDAFVWGVTYLALTQTQTIRNVDYFPQF